MANNPKLRSYDLAYEHGTAAEGSLRWLLDEANILTFESKSQPWSKTHVFIEHAKVDPDDVTGISATEADAYAIEIRKGWWVIVPIDIMRKMHATAIRRFGERDGGRDERSRGAVIPKQWLVGLK